MAAAVALDIAADLPPLCVHCQKAHGLCGRHDCRQAVLPQLAKPAWVRLIGELRTEQKKRQKKAHTPVEAKSLNRLKARKRAREIARQGRGYFAMAIAAHTAKKVTARAKPTIRTFVSRVDGTR